MFEKLVKSDVGIVICSFLNPKDILSLYRVFPTIVEKTQYEYKNSIVTTIDNYFRFVFSLIKEKTINY